MVKMVIIAFILCLVLISPIIVGMVTAAEDPYDREIRDEELQRESTTSPGEKKRPGKKNGGRIDSDGQNVLFC